MTAPKATDGVAKILSKSDVEKMKAAGRKKFVLECEFLGSHAVHVCCNVI